jgi:two-component system, OmpR family, sensor kinase
VNLRQAFNRTLFWRLLVSLCVANVLVLVLGTWVAQSFISLGEQQHIDWTSLAMAANDAYDKGGEDGLRTWMHARADDGIDAALYENGRSIVRADLPRDVRRSISGWIQDGHDVELNSDPGYYVAFEEISGTNPQRQLVAATNSRSRLSRHTKEHILFFSQLVLWVCFVAAIGWWTARSVSRPIEAMRAATRHMAGGDFSTRISARWSARQNEFGDLSRDFNAMAERIGTLVDHERSILQDLSHELRSPLARLLASLHLAGRQNPTPAALAHIERAESEVAHMDRLTSEMLALSRMEADLPGMEREWIDLAALTAQCVESARLDAEKRSVQIHLDHAGQARVLGSEMLIERVIDNLISNAVKYSPENGRIEVNVRQAGNGSEWRIRDHGPGVPEEDIQRLFQPFYRGANATLASGHGLGLSIVRRVVDLHDGDVQLRNAEPQGLEVVLTFRG